ncbi:MAG: Asp-tRNA(Asn)/Glu-tRNA(Gln) amidotransferase subunit GatC [Chitinivibrionales bacterium]|nr:Asp-tRNA(Asn)/Glu-tRNA(Gln) amidotransferase subunit GatC [Chitinivibrionales bacterium]
MIDRKDVEHVAQLARLKLTDDEIESFAEQLSEVIEYVDLLDKAPTDDVGPTCFLVPRHDPLREDTAGESLPREKLMANAPKVCRAHFAVPKVITTGFTPGAG